MTPTNTTHSRWKTKEVDTMRERTPLLALQQGVKAAAPARDFIGALRAKAAETGAGAAHRAVVLAAWRLA